MSNLFQGDILAPLGSSKDLRSVLSISWCICSKDTFGLGHYPIEEYIFFSLVTVSRHIQPNQKMVVGRMLVEISLEYTCVNLPHDLRVGCLIFGLSMVYWSFEG